MPTSRTRRGPAALLLALAIGATVGAAACAPAVGPALPARAVEPGGHLVLVGGGAKPAAAMRLFVELAGGADARLVILPMASGESRLAGAEYVEAFAALGVAHVDVVHVDDRRDAFRPAYAAKLRGATGVWFSGGDQRRIAAYSIDTPLLAALTELKARGGVVGGTSAGTACQSGIMLTGDGRAAPGQQVFARGLDLAPGVILDTHFRARRRQARLRAALVDHPERVGLGVDEGTAAWLRPDGTLEVLGAGAVLVYGAPTAGGAMDTVTETVVVPGQRWDLRARQLVEGGP